MSVQGGNNNSSRNNNNNVEADEIEDAVMEMWHEGDDAEDEMMMTMGMWEEQEEHNRRNAEAEWLQIEDWIMDVDEDVEEVSLASGPTNTNNHHCRTLVGADLNSNDTELKLHFFRLDIDALENLVNNGYGNKVKKVELTIRLQESIMGRPPFDDGILEELKARLYRLGRLISRFLNMNELEIKHYILNVEMMAAPVLQGLEKSTNLTRLVLNSLVAIEDPMQDLVAAFQSPALQNLEHVWYLGGPCSDMVQEAILKLPKLNFLTFATTYQHGDTQRIVTGLANGTASLLHLTLRNFNWDCTFGTVLASALENPSCKLRRLILSNPYNLNDDKWRLGMSFLGKNKMLETLSITETGGICGISGILLVETINQIAENENSALKILELEVRNETTMAAHYIDAVERLSKNTTLEYLDINVFGDTSLSIDFDEDSYRRLVEAAQRNYGICMYGGAPHRLTGEKGSDKSALNVIGRLNKAGRQYLTMGPKFKSSVANVLSHKVIRDDPDAIFFHLQEHPELWYRY